MAKFLLETESVSSAADSIKSMGSSVSSLSSTVSSYDTSDGDGEGFPFSAAKQSIASNIEACSTRISNTASVLQSVVSEHTALQNSMKYGESSAAQESSTAKTKGTSTTSGTATGSTTSTSSGGGYSGGGYSGGGYSGGSSSVRSRSSKKKAVSKHLGTISTSASIANSDKVDKDKTAKKNDTDNIKAKTTTKVDINKVGCAYENTENQSEESKTVFNSSSFKYDDKHYATYDSKYVVACDSSVGKVGDVIRIVKKDGTEIECLVGVNTTSVNNKNSINFIIDKNVTDQSQINTTIESLPLKADDYNSFTNCGNIDTVKQNTTTDSIIEINTPSSTSTDSSISTVNSSDTTEIDTSTPASTDVSTSVTGDIDSSNVDSSSSKSNDFINSVSSDDVVET